MSLPKRTLEKWLTSLELPIGVRDDVIKSISDVMLDFTVDTASDTVLTIDKDADD